VLTGSNRDESFGGNPKSAADFVAAARKRFGDVADAYLKLYPASSDEEVRESAFYSGGDEMAFVMRNWARLAEKPGKSKAFVYYFTQQPPRLANARGAFAPPYWVNFATNGDPNGQGLTRWPYDGNQPSVMMFGDRPEGPQAPADARLAFFQSYFDAIDATAAEPAQSGCRPDRRRNREWFPSFGTGVVRLS